MMPSMDVSQSEIDEMTAQVDPEIEAELLREVHRLLEAKLPSAHDRGGPRGDPGLLR